MQFKIKILAAISTLMLLQGCSEEFLDRPPLDALTSGNFYKTDAEILAGTAPLYNIVWFDFNDKANMSFQEARAGNLNSNDRTAYVKHAVPSTDVNTLLPGYKSFYKIIAQSNNAFKAINEATGSTASAAVKSQGLGECRFMRATAYYYLVTNWGAVPIVYDNVAQLNEAPVRNRIEDVWKLLIQDYRYAAANLPATADQGRLTKYSAEGMLARMYLMRAGLNQSGTRNQSDLDSAKYYAEDVITKSGRTLAPTYGELFESANHNASKNNAESLFSLQWMPVSNPWGVNNSFQAYFAYDANITTTGDGWGAAQGLSADLVKYFTENPADSLRRKAIAMFDSDVYPNLQKATGGLKYVRPEQLAAIKKYIVGSPADNGGLGGFMAANINSYMLRLAEVYLIYADAVLGNAASTSDAKALEYFNAVRKRAGLANKTSLTFEDIFQERRIETVFEGNSWNEVVRWYYFNPAKAIAYTAKQRRENYTMTYVPGSTNPKKYTVTYSPAEYYPLAANTLYLPFPEGEIVNAPSLKDEPVPFDFSKLVD
ncbi:SusD-like protein [Dyadobacter sp. CECT 9623]|uniref:SusD-like protein n=1 Tax=Dyadobacter linearis TaxID=2823330 RepID=A0ABN7R1N3_9BACT|nr:MULTISPECIES: RagB/SusD family nutrient uptake outer membrane protein [unclassified Dyadobacter]MCE7063126.1 RagB/SusD family nutrient uptake outer membrane protein [Dyadobacter sp. CY343]CAG5068070.1 SusD-like protein [Dyadobacter sp. CECT 9623]